MSPKSIDQLYWEAAQLPSEAEQAAYLERECGGNPGLRGKVERLLAVRAEAASFLEQPAVSPPVPAAGETASLNPDAATSAYDAPPAEAGTVIAGRYKLLEEIGEGGMGTVWMAEQTEPVQRRVAVKLIKPGMDSKQVVARFEAERQALALMDHPNIAKVLDGGATDDGRPFFVMELVKGTPITKFCDEKKLPVRERLELFADVCRAVQHAHQKGIIHRDLKPSNVMVAPYDGRAVVKVIDFGVAKAAGQKLTEATLFTGFGAVVGTPEYMSPEQAELNNADIDTRSDIYSLGVILYELLTGTTPLTRQRVKEAALLEVLRVIREEEPPRPSTRLSSTTELPSIAAVRGVEPAKLSRLVRGELDWIVMKSLEKDRTRRYETANGFAADVQRYLSDEPVQACPPSAGYRLGKFARRNKGRLTAAGLVLFCLVLLGGGVGWAVRDRGARQAQAGGQIDLILAEVAQLEQEQKWPQALAAARRAEAVLAGGEADAATEQRVREHLKDLEFVDRLEQIRMLLAWMGQSFDYASTDRAYAEAFKDYGVDVDRLAVETSVQRLKTRPQFAIPFAAALDDRVAGRRFMKTDALDWTRLVAVARGIDPEPVRDRLRATLGRPDTEVEDELLRLAKSIDLRAQHPETIRRLAVRLVEANQPDAAVRLLRDAQSQYPGDFWINYNLGTALKQQNDHEGAIRFLTAAVAIRPQAVAALNNLGNALQAPKELEEAVAVYRKAIEIDPRCAFAYRNLGIALRDQKKLDDALAALGTAIELDPRYAGAHDTLGALLCDELGEYAKATECFRKAIELDPKSAVTHANLGTALQRQKKLPEAIDACRKAIALDPKLANAHKCLGDALAELEKFEEAAKAYRKVIELDPEQANAHANLGLVLQKQGKAGESIAPCRRAIEIDPHCALFHYNLGLSFRKLKEPGMAIECFRKAIELDQAYANAYNDLGNALADQAKVNEAIDAYRKAIELDSNTAGFHYNLGLAFNQLNEFAKAVGCFQKAIELEPDVSRSHYNLGVSFNGLNQPDKAIECFRKAVDLDPENPYGHDALGSALRAAKRPGEAIAAYRRLIEIAPRVADGYLSLGTVLCDDLQDYAGAIEWFRKAIELEPRNPVSYQCLAVALRGQKKLDEAIDANRKAFALDPRNPNSRRRLAWELNNRAWGLATDPDPQKRDPARATKLAKEAIDLDKSKGFAWQTLAWAQYRAGDWKAAITSMEKVKELGSPGDSTEWFLLAMAHWQLGNEDEARSWYVKAVEWMDKKAPRSVTLRRFRSEVAELFKKEAGLKKQESKK